MTAYPSRLSLFRSACCGLFCSLFLGCEDKGIVETHTEPGWTVQQSGTTETLFGVSFVDSYHGAAVGESGTILHTTDGGTTWVKQMSGTSNTLLGVCFTDSNTGTAVGGEGTILRTTDGGDTWVSQVSNTTDGLLDVSFADAENGMVIGGLNAFILTTTNGGLDWVPSSPLPITGVVNSFFLINASTATVVGNSASSGGTIFHTTDRGATWLSQTSGTTSILVDVYFTDANRGTIVGQDGLILRTTDGGVTWEGQYPPATFFPMAAVSFIGSERGTAVGSSVMATTDGGATWFSQMSGTESILYDISYLDSTTEVAVGEFGTILRTTTGGEPLIVVDN